MEISNKRIEVKDLGRKKGTKMCPFCTHECTAKIVPSS